MQRKNRYKKLKFEYNTNRYIKYLNSRFNLNDKLIIENTELSQCLDCNLIFNKWLKEYYIKTLYSETDIIVVESFFYDFK